MNNVIFRIFIFIILLVSLLFPWWVTLVLSLFALIRFSSYYEILFLGFVFDVLYAVPFLFFPRFPVAIVVAYILLLSSFFFKKYLRV